MYALVSASRTLLRTCIRLHVDEYKLLVRVLVSATCIWCKHGFKESYYTVNYIWYSVDLPSILLTLLAGCQE